MIQIFSKLLISKFYKMNAGFFLFLFIILFGILPGPDTIRLHRGLMSAATSSPAFAAVAAIIFLLFNFKCISFTYKEMEQPENGFLYNMQGISNARQFLLFAYYHASVYSPFLMYALIMARVGFQEHHYLLASFTIIWQLIICGIAVYLYFSKLNNTWKNPAFTLPSITLFPDKNFSFYLLYHSLYSRKGAFIAIKIFSLLALQFLVVLNADKTSRENVCFLILLSISAHALLPVYYVQFMEGELPFLRNLPLSILKRLSIYIITYSVIFIPELLFLLWNEHTVLSISIIISLYLLAIGRLTLFTSLQYFKGMDVNRYTGVVFVLFFVTLILLASVNLWVFIIAESVIGIFLFYLLYYKYENANQPI